jgi:hypothetical protein
MRSLASRLRPLWFLLIVVLGCDGGPSGPSTGRLRVSILGLPAGSAADVTVSGSSGFSQPVTGTMTLTQLTPGTYTVTAATVMVGASQYAPSPLTQTIMVNGSDAQSNASIFYSSASGNLAITINGLGTASTANVTVTGPSYTQAVASTRTLTGLNPGTYHVAAGDAVATGGTTHTAAPTDQDVTVAAGGTASATVTYSAPNSGLLNLRIAGLYITQSTQTFPGGVPLVRNRDGYLRVFVIANRTTISTEVPQVRVRFFSGIVPLDSSLILPPGLSVPTAVDESQLSYTWNVPVSGALIQPGLSIQAEVDPANTVSESDELDNVFPATGLATPAIQTAPALNITFVPIHQSATGEQGDVTDANKNAFLDVTKRMHPIDAVDAIVHPAMTTTNTLGSNGNGWIEVLAELDALRVSDASSRYYYGVAKVGYSSGVAGIAYVSDASGDARAAMGWDYLSSGSEVAAHELAHNWGRFHAPCGNPANPDAAYPYSGGVIGAYGLDVGTVTPKPPSTSDIMGYCPNKWISDYNYKAVMNYRTAHPLVMSSVVGQAVQPSLLVWGHISDGKLVLEPAFQVNTRPSLPARPGPYSLEGRTADGTTLFAFSFTPDEIADVPGSHQAFAFAVPISAAKAAGLGSIRLSGHGREAVLTPSVSAASPTTPPQAGAMNDSVQVRRVGRGRVGLRWNASAHPMVMVRDVETGQVLAFARGGAVELATSKAQVDLVLSDGVKSRLRRVRVTR